MLAIARLLQSASPEVSTIRKEPSKRKPPAPPLRRAANTLLLTAGGDSGQELALTFRDPRTKKQ